MTSESVSDAGLRQYEDINLTPAALSFFENMSRPGLQNRDTSSGQTAPTAALVMETITNLLDGRPDALQILLASAGRLGSNPPQHDTDPGLYSVPQRTPEPISAVVPGGIAASFAYWRYQSRQALRLRHLTASFRSSRRSETPQVTFASTWAERDAALREEAVSLKSTSSTLSAELSASLPFSLPSELPADLVSSKDHQIICRILSSRIDRQLTRWRRRVLFTAENWANWAEWSAPSKTHRDARASGLVFLNSAEILTYPDLRSHDIDVAADAWHHYRRRLLIHLRQALTVGVSWPDILSSLATIYDDPDYGYPRLVSYITAALEDHELLKFPLLHANVLIYKLDCSYGDSSQRYAVSSTTLAWDAAISRQHGEDPVSLAIRVTNACLTKQDDPSLTNITVWSHPVLANEINKRFGECLLNDEAWPNRGEDNHLEFHKTLLMTKARLERGLAKPNELSCEYIANHYIAPHEIASARGLYASQQPAQPQQLLTHSGPTGHGSRERRNERRAHLQPHQEEPPPSAYRTGSLPCQG